MYKFEKLEVWQLAIEYTDLCYSLAEHLPKREEYNLASQLRRAAVSVALNIAEGSTGQSDAEQARFLGWHYAPSLRQSPVSISSIAVSILMIFHFCVKRIRQAINWRRSYWP